MIPEEIILNAAENINNNLARLTDLEIKFVNYASFGRRLEANNSTGKFNSYTEVYDAVFEYFYQSDDTGDMASCECGIITLIFIKRRSSISTIIMYDTQDHKFYSVTKDSDGTYSKTSLYVSNSDIEKDYLNPLKTSITEEYKKHVATATEALDASWAEKSIEQHNSMMTTLTAVDNELRNLINSILEGADADLDQFKEVSSKIKEMLAADKSIIDLLHAVETTCIDNGDQSITYTLLDNQSVNFNNNNLTVLNLTIPSVFHGFKSYVTFKASKTTILSVLNNSGINAIWLLNSMMIDESEFELIAGAYYNILFECNGANVFVRIEEIE